MFTWYPDYEALIAQVQLVLFMLGMGVNLQVGDFLLVLRRPRSFLSALVGQLLVIPFIAVGINWLFGFEGGVAVGLLLVATMPGAALSKFFTYLGNGNVPLSITLSTVTTLATIVIVPLWLRLLMAEYVPEGFAIPAERVVVDVACFLLLPLVVGMAIGRQLPERRKQISRLCLRAGLLTLLLMVLGALGSGRIKPTEYGFAVPLAITLFCVLGQQLNQVSFYVMGWPRADRLAAAIEVTMRNMNLALLLYADFFAKEEHLSGGVLFVILFYAAVAMVAAVPLTLRHRRSARKEAKTSPHGNEKPA
jgi:BASS family bile acid:Na+ symporter